MTSKPYLRFVIIAASSGDSIENTAKLLKNIPTANDIRYHLNKINNFEELETRNYVCWLKDWGLKSIIDYKVFGERSWGKNFLVYCLWINIFFYSFFIRCLVENSVDLSQR